MPDIGDYATATLTVDPFGGSTAATLLVSRPDGTTTSPSATTANGGATWTAVVQYTMAGQWLLKWTVTGTGQGTEYQQVFVTANPTVGGQPYYADLETLRLSVSMGSDVTSQDRLLLRNLAAASRGIDNFCGRRFWRDTTTTARRYRTRDLTAPDPDGELLFVDDIATTEGLVVETGDGVTWTTVTDYTAEPEDYLARVRPITGLRRDPGLAWSSSRYVRVTAVWGFPAIPDEVVEACLLQAARLFKRKDSPEGVSGSAEWGAVRLSRIDPDVGVIVKDLMKMVA